MLLSVAIFPISEPLGRKLFGIQLFSEIRLPGTGPKQAPQNDPEMGANSDPGGLQKAENDDVK